ncbi:Quaternary ammonium compound-resistance protein SugE [Andreprevotia sp. IGB-42]|uniref:DMT family transporter n=1 Tax=Andreprevotia sp. IGB-42 TaxID=2497473 RepID=UPI00135BAEA8|nr:SMR family transporter [Andreprevotia sp. IGB-42]KAF0814965.1 Quaternary ammonium compound-resistance protein SugE [Andreprevotia sp. IGB-42]
MAWLLLLAAGAVEIVMAVALKYADGWSKPVPGVIGIAAALLSIFLLARALPQLPAGTAYAVWTGIGSVGVAVLGIVLFGDSPSAARLLCMALIVAGIVGLRLIEN